jgi:predicted phage terminase large subunit-like protein
VTGPSADREQAIRRAYQEIGPVRLRYCPLTPTPRQEAFLRLPVFEAFFGGAAAGGKTVSLLMAALQYADVPGYHALLLRPSLTELQLPGGLIDLSQTWLATTDASWSGDLKQWRFPGQGRSGTGGATVGFGYLDGPNDVARYAGTSYSYLAFDELGRFTEHQYLRMLRVLRQPGDHDGRTYPGARDGTRLTDVPLRVRSASNPGGPNHARVKARFVDPNSRHPGAVFLPARLADNPFIDQVAYAKTLAHLPLADRERLLHGDWEIPDDGELFQRDWFPIVEPRDVPEGNEAVRYWDLAATEPGPANRDPDYTVGLRLDLHRASGVFYITDIVRTRKAPGEIERLVADTARRDGRSVAIRIEQEPGAAGVSVAQHYTRDVLQGYRVKVVRTTGPKEVRARVVAAAADNGLVKLVSGRHSQDFLDELTAFPHGAHDDCVDALAGGHEALTQRRVSRSRIGVPRGHLPDYIQRDPLGLGYTTYPG